MKKNLILVSLILGTSQFTWAVPEPEPQSCAFGSGLEELFQNPRFNITRNIFETYKISRIEPPDTDNLLFVTIDLLTDTKTNRQYQLNTTFQDYYDGGNTIGWIEDTTAASENPADLKVRGEVVAKIGDSWIYDCTVQ